MPALDDGTVLAHQCFRHLDDRPGRHGAGGDTPPGRAVQVSASRSALRQAWTSHRPTSRELCLGIGVYAKANRLFLGRAVRHQGPELLEPGVVSCSAWRAATPTPDVAMYAGVGRK